MQGTTEDDAMEINSAMNHVARTDGIQGPQVYYTNRDLQCLNVRI